MSVVAKQMRDHHGIHVMSHNHIVRFPAKLSEYMIFVSCTIRSRHPGAKGWERVRHAEHALCGLSVNLLCMRVHSHTHSYSCTNLYLVMLKAGLR